MPRLFFLLLAFKRLINRLGLSLLMMISIALAMGVILAAPLFAGAVSRSMMQQELAERSKWTHRPPFSVRFYAVPSEEQSIGWDEVVYARRWLANSLVRRLGLPVVESYVQLEGPTMSMRPVQGDTHYVAEALDDIRVICAANIAKHIRIVEGEPFGSDPNPQRLPVWVLLSLATERGFCVGDQFDLQLEVPDGLVTASVQIAGVWEAIDETERYWYHSPYGLLGQELLTTPQGYMRHIATATQRESDFAFWYFVLDDTRMSLDRADHYIDSLKAIELEVGRFLPSGRMDYAPLAELELGQQRKRALSSVLLAFNLPLIGILAFFVASLSAMVARSQERETTMLVSRGSSRSQIVAMTLLETVLMLLAACPLGAVLALFLARQLSRAQEFLVFTSRSTLHVQLASLNWLHVGLVVAVLLPSRLLPAWGAAGSTIVQSERQAARSVKGWSVARLLWLVLLAGLTLYTYRQLRHTGPLALMGWQPGAPPPRDPLLLLAPSLFFLTAPWLAAEMFPLLMRPLAWAGRLVPSATIYLTCLNLGRGGGRHQVPVFLLVLCLSLGAFYASVASSADRWLQDRHYYAVGADLSFEPSVMIPQGLGEAEAPPPGNVWFIPVSEYRQLPGVLDATRVADYRGRVALEDSSRELRVLGIDRADFGRVAYFRPDFSARSLGLLMNLLARCHQGIMIPEHLAEQLILREGDVLALYVLVEREWRRLEFEVVGTFAYFPTMYEEELPAVVINLDYLERQMGGVSAHSIWMRLPPQMPRQQILDEIRSLEVLPKVPRLSRELIARDRESQERLGIVGTLSLCFLTGALLAIIDLVVYHASAIRVRSVRFAILHTMGMRRAEIISMVSLEYLVILLWGIIVGTALGILGSHLYVPFFPLTENPEITTPPFVPIVDWDRARWMAIGMIGILIAILAVSVWMLARLKVFELLRMSNARQ